MVLQDREEEEVTALGVFHREREDGVRAVELHQVPGAVVDNGVQVLTKKVRAFRRTRTKIARIPFWFSDEEQIVEQN